MRDGFIEILFGRERRPLLGCAVSDSIEERRDGAIAQRVTGDAGVIFNEGGAGPRGPRL